MEFYLEASEWNLDEAELNLLNDIGKKTIGDEDNPMCQFITAE